MRIAGQETSIVHHDQNRSVVKDDDLATSVGAGLISRNVVNSDNINENPVGAWPSEMRFGLAWFASTRLLWTMDMSYYTEAKGDIELYNRESVINFATGAEYYITPSVPVRFGLFTNNDARAELDSAKINQPDHIDYTGLSLFFAWVQPNSQVALGTVMQNGSGKAQKISGVTTMQDVSAVSRTIAFSATHSF